MRRPWTCAVSIFFQSWRSSSSGNCLALWTATSSILIDCGVQTRREFDVLLCAHARHTRDVAGVVVSHAHGDHATRTSLRVLEREGIAVHANSRVIRQLRERHTIDAWTKAPRFRAFPGDEGFRIGDFRVAPVELPHAPAVPTFGFVITVRDERATRKMVVCTDFHDFGGLLPHFADADFIFVEANHDLQLLREHPNFNSRYHLNNVQTASLLNHAIRRSASPPAAVMLGHLSEERNRKRLAIDEVRSAFDRSRARLTFHLDAAPAGRPSDIIEI